MAKNLYFPVYFDDWKPIRQKLTAKQGWLLFNACLDYAEHGIPLESKDPVISLAFDLLANGIDRSKQTANENAAKKRYARYCGVVKGSGEVPLSFEEWLTSVDKCQQPSTDVNKRDNLIQSNLIQSNLIEESIAAKPPRAPVLKYGEFGWIRLTVEQYEKLLADLGEAELARCIQYIDEAAQQTGNKNKWKDWNLVLRKCSRERWGVKNSAAVEEDDWRKDAVIAWSGSK